MTEDPAHPILHNDSFHNVTSQLLGVFRVRGCAPRVAEELAQKVTGKLKRECERYFAGPA